MKDSNEEIIYDVNYFINKFKDIPEELWCTGSYTQIITEPQKEITCHCALGHCGYKLISTGVSVYLNRTDEGKALVKLFSPEFESAGEVFDINDAIIAYGKTPKERILNKLYEIKDENETV